MNVRTKDSTLGHLTGGPNARSIRVLNVEYNTFASQKNRKFSAYKVSENRVLFNNGNQQMPLGYFPFLLEQNLS